MAFFKGAAKEAQRAMQLQRQREKDRRELELAKMRLESEMRIGEIKNKFAAHSGASYADQTLGETTVGLVTLDEMKRHQERMKRRAAASDAAAGSATAAKKAALSAAGGIGADAGRPRAGGLSFDPADEEEQEEEDEEDDDARDEDQEEKEDKKLAEMRESNTGEKDKEAGEGEDADEDQEQVERRDDCDNTDAQQQQQQQSAGGRSRRRFGKDPRVDTWFLPDRDREAEERLMRAQIEQEWHESQARLRAEEMEVVFSYWDGSGHRRSVQVTKGNTIGQFLRKVLEQLRKEFQELRSVSEDQLMFIKEDTILPHHVAFLDLITSKARGKSGPLYLFDVKQDVRLTVDTALPSQETHAGKVCMRQWYDRNKHIFPASRWEPFDPAKNWDSLPASQKTATFINVK